MNESIDNCKILAGIVTYNPTISRFKDCLSAVRSQVEDVFIFDNGSQNIEDILDITDGYDSKVVLFKNGENAGIATALAHIMEYACANQFCWVLSMDQDSLLQPGIIDVYRKTIFECKNVAMLTCLIKDRNFSDPKYEAQFESKIEVDYCITSGALTNVEAYNKTSGYDHNFFIDCVDFDICYSLREAGYKIVRVNHVGLLHEVGHGENRKFLWKTIVVYHEKPIRVFYLARNTKWLYKKHKSFSLVKLIKKEFYLFIRIVFYEDKRKEKLVAFLKGIFSCC